MRAIVGCEPSLAGIRIDLVELVDDLGVGPGGIGEIAVDDRRLVVRYPRRARDGRIGGEIARREWPDRRHFNRVRTAAQSSDTPPITAAPQRAFRQAGHCLARVRGANCLPRTRPAVSSTGSPCRARSRVGRSIAVYVRCHEENSVLAPRPFDTGKRKGRRSFLLRPRVMLCLRITPPPCGCRRAAHRPAPRSHRSPDD